MPALLAPAVPPLDTDPAGWETLGPWDALHALSVPKPRHMLETQANFSSAQVDFPHGSNIHLISSPGTAPRAGQRALSKQSPASLLVAIMLDLHQGRLPQDTFSMANPCAEGEEAIGIHVQPPASSANFVITVHASPTGEDWWEDTAVRELASSSVTELIRAHAVPDISEIAEVSMSTGIFGTEIHITHDDSNSLESDGAGSPHGSPSQPSASARAPDNKGRVRNLVIWGHSGPRWTVKLAAYGTDVSDADMEIGHQILSSLIVYRGKRPYPPGTPLPLGLVK